MYTISSTSCANVVGDAPQAAVTELSFHGGSLDGKTQQVPHVGRIEWKLLWGPHWHLPLSVYTLESLEHLGGNCYRAHYRCDRLELLSEAAARADKPHGKPIALGGST